MSSTAGDAGAADERIDPAERRDGRIERRSHLVFVGDVEPCDMHIGGQRPRRRAQRIGIAVPQAHARARVEQAARDGQPDTGGAAGDEHGSALQVQAIHAFSSVRAEIAV
jgi:hypothetical protein